MKHYDVIVIGAGAAGLMCAAQARRRDKKVLIIERSEKAGKKILISGGGRCNFTNLGIKPQAYLSNNTHFCKSALSRYTQWDFISQLENHGLTWHEKTLGQLFCHEKSSAVLAMLLKECEGVDFWLNSLIDTIEYQKKYIVKTSSGVVTSTALVVATGGASIPKMGATDFGLKIAQQFGINTLPFVPALVALTFHPQDIERYFKDLSGLSINAIVSYKKQSFRENILITHKGISGPAILQISSYWQQGQEININLLPDIDAGKWLLSKQKERKQCSLKTLLSQHFPKRLAARFADVLTNKKLADTPIMQISQNDLTHFGNTLNNWTIRPNNTQGMRTAEVCTGGVDTHELCSKTMVAKKQEQLYFIGETVDVTGWLGGYNFQWAWSSGWAAGQVV